jgi:predicted AAA+ superfamily ATPase
MERLPPELDANLRSMNPWWQGKPAPVLPPYRRWAFHTTLRKLESGLAPITVLRGPRQVGKTTLQQQLIQHFFQEQAVPAERILRVQFDELPSLKDKNTGREPILSIARWFENRILGRTFNEAAHENLPAYLFLDEVQNLPDWAPQLKSLVDHHTVKVLVTGSSALRIEQGRDSLAGRITQVELGTLLLREIAALRFGGELPPCMPANGLESLLKADFWMTLQTEGKINRQLRDKAFAAFSERGGYPVAHASADVPWPEIADHLNETVIKRAIEHDLRIEQRGRRRDPPLLQEVYRLACRYTGQSPSQSVYVQEIKRGLGTAVGWQRVRAYLRFLEEAILLKLIEPLELRSRRRPASGKVCICDHGLRASWLQETIPLDPDTLDAIPLARDLAGHIAESIVGFYLSGIPHLDVAHFPERGVEPEVDFVLTIGAIRIPLEVKYRRNVDPHHDTRGLRSFLEQTLYNAPFGILVTMEDAVQIPDPRIIPISLPSFLLLR